MCKKNCGLLCGKRLFTFIKHLHPLIARQPYIEAACIGLYIQCYTSLADISYSNLFYVIPDKTANQFMHSFGPSAINNDMIIIIHECKLFDF